MYNNVVARPLSLYHGEVLSFSIRIFLPTPSLTGGFVMPIRRTIKRNESGRIPNSFPKSSLIISVQENGGRSYVRETFFFYACIYTFCPLICPTTLPTIRPTTNGVTQPNPTADKGMTEMMDFAASRLLSPGNASISA